jgi:DNA-binding transcriptional LysR family regulator
MFSPPKDLDLTTLRLFVQVCDARSILQVSGREGVVPSAITKRLARLERELGVTLLRRGGGGVIPTSAGLALAANARSLLQESRRLHDAMGLYKEGAAGFVSMSATHSAIAGHLMDDVARFQSDPRYGEARIAITQGVTSEVVLAVREGRAALGIVWDMTELGGLRSTSYGHDQLVIGVRADHPLAGRVSVSIPEAFEHAYISFPWAQTFIDMLLRAGTLSKPPAAPRLSVPTLEAAMRCAARGLGLCVIPVEATSPLSEALGLRVIGLQDAWAVRHHAICWREETAQTPMARQLVDHLAQCAAERERLRKGAR